MTNHAIKTPPTATQAILQGLRIKAEDIDRAVEFMGPLPWTRESWEREPWTRARQRDALEIEPVRIYWGHAAECGWIPAWSMAGFHFHNLRRAYLPGVDLRGACVSGGDLRWSVLRGANLQGANMRAADLRGCSLKGANLQGANMRAARLTGANLQEVRLRSADLRAVVGLGQAHLDCALGCGCTRWPDGFEPAEHGAIVSACVGLCVAR